MGKVTWTKEQEEYLEELYSRSLPLDETTRLMNEFSGIKRSSSGISNKANKLGLTQKYIKPNNPKFTAAYQDYDWCYDKFVEKGLNHEEMAKLANCTKRVIEKWCQEKHRIDVYTRMYNKKINQKQHDLIIGSLLGDGHIDRREDYPLFIVSHAEDQKDYLFYKYDILKDLCEMTPTKYKGKENYQIINSVCNCQDFYRFNTRTYIALKPYRNMTKTDLLYQLNDYSFAIWMLDDGCCTDKGYWELCAPFDTDEERSIFIEVLWDKFRLEAIQQSNNRYFRFHTDDSWKITMSILNNVPSYLDIIQNKIFSKKKYKDLQEVYNE